MRKNLIYTLSGLFGFGLFFLLKPLLNEEIEQPKKLVSSIATLFVPKQEQRRMSFYIHSISIKLNQYKTPSFTKIIKSNTTGVVLKKVSFTQLPGWGMVNVKKSFSTFQISCKTFLQQEPLHVVGSQYIRLHAQDWQPACREALALQSVSEYTARAFFETWFLPIELDKRKPLEGLFTGYYMPLLKGSLIKTKTFNTPIYGLPNNKSDTSEKTHAKSKHNNPAHYTREEIDKGALKEKAPILAWVKTPIDRLFLEIEGAGVIKLPSGRVLYVGYAGENGAPYTSIAGVLIKKGMMNADNASTQTIKHYFEKHPRIMHRILNQNKSFVFFQNLQQTSAQGAQGTPLTPGYSLAVDKRWIPLGAPLWLATKKPDLHHHNKEKRMERLMIAQDTGGAIQGVVRGDVYWGAGKNATFLAEHMKNKGHYWLLLPKKALGIEGI